MPRLALNELKDTAKRLSGASAVGVAAVRPVDDHARRLYDDWISQGRHGAMAYMERYTDVRDNPALLLEGAQTIIMAAFSYANPEAVRQMERSGAPLISEYALGTDYHTEIKKRLGLFADELTKRYGGKVRVCVDTAPLRERYWAQQAGLGFIGINNYLILPGMGMHFVLGAVLWTGQPVDGYDLPVQRRCDNCGRCVAHCPNGTLHADGSLDARKCLAYLTIESKDPMPHGINFGNRLFGCDTCRRVCPHEPSAPPSTEITAFKPNPELLTLTRQDWLEMTPDRYNSLFRHTALHRTKLPKLLDTLRHLTAGDS